jgi:Tfp pilus assembly protein PilX
MTLRRSPDKTFRTRQLKPARRAAVIVFAMVVLLVLSLLGGELVRTMVSAHRQAIRQDRETQCLWLAEAGLDRALAQLQSNSAYAGETWQPIVDESADESDVERAGRVVIVVATKDGQRQVRVQAAYPDHPTDRALVERVYSLPSVKEESP